MRKERAGIGGSVIGFFKNKNTVLLLACGGIILVLFASSLFGGSGREKAPKSYPDESLTNMQFIERTEHKLQSMINGMVGVESCDVMLTLETGIEYRYATDEADSIKENGNSGGGSVQSESSRDTETTVTKVNDRSAGERALIVTEVYPAVKGVAVVCRGKDTAELKLSIIETVSTVLGINTGRVCVIMKG